MLIGPSLMKILRVSRKNKGKFLRGLSSSEGVYTNPPNLTKRQRCRWATRAVVQSGPCKYGGTLDRAVGCRVIPEKRRSKFVIGPSSMKILRVVEICLSPGHFSRYRKMGGRSWAVLSVNLADSVPDDGCGYVDADSSHRIDSKVFSRRRFHARKLTPIPNNKDEVPGRCLLATSGANLDT